MMFRTFVFTHTLIGPCFPGFGVIFHAFKLFSLSKHMNLKHVAENLILIFEWEYFGEVKTVLIYMNTYKSVCCRLTVTINV